MRAVTHREYGYSEVIKLEQRAPPEPSADEALIQVQAASVNRTDCAILTAKPFIMRLFMGLRRPRQQILGTAFAGRVTRLGNAVTNLEVGDDIIGFNDMGAACMADYVTCSAAGAITKAAANATPEASAAAIEGAHYALNFLNKVTVQTGQHALVNGATGAVGSALVQLLRNQGVIVTAVCKAKDFDLVRALGATTLIDYEREDFTETTQRFDLVLDAVGKSTFRKCRHLLHRHGSYISSEAAPYAQNIWYSLLTPLLPGPSVRFPAPLRPRKSLHTLRTLMEENLFEPVIDKRYPIEAAVQAFAHVLGGEKTGNVVITMDPG